MMVRCLDFDMEVLELPFQGNTALKSASKFGHLEIIKFLLESGANVNIKGGKVFQFRCTGSSTNTLLRCEQLSTA
jgi:ankyrin repeat protein